MGSVSRTTGRPAGLSEFLTVYGRNAYFCADCIPFVGCACKIAFPDPIYWMLWAPLYTVLIDMTDGSCAGMSATSLLMARELLQPEAFEPDVHFPIGFDKPGPDAEFVQELREDGSTVSYYRGVPTYDDTSVCTPVCSPPRPANLWSTIRMNHGVQLSREFLAEVLDAVGESIFDPDDVGSIKAVPEVALERVRADPAGYVLCFFEFGNGHCVTPYRVDGNRIYVYNNNRQSDASRHIEIADGNYDYPARRAEDNPPYSGNAIVAFPIEIWRNSRHVIGLNDLVTSVGGDPIAFLQMIAVGAADVTVTTPTGGRWGLEDDGTFTDALPGAVALPPLGPQANPSRAMPLVMAMNQPPPQVQLNVRQSGPYSFHTAAGGHLFQVEAGHGVAGDKDHVSIAHAAGRLESFTLTPQRRASRLVPRVGLTLGDQESSVFHWFGLDVPAGTRVGFGGSKEERDSVYLNDTTGATHHVLALDHASGPANRDGRMIYGPFEVPHGAAHRVSLANWPEVTQVTSELDFDRDGTPDHTEVVTGRTVPPATRPQTGSADLSVSKATSTSEVALGQPVTFTVTVTNAGPDAATNVTLTDVLPPSAALSQITSTRGSCSSAPDGLTCAIGTLTVGQRAIVTYVARTALPGTLANGALVSGDEADPALLNNYAVATVILPTPVDIKPGNAENIVNPGAIGVLAVAILGRPGFDVSTVDPSSLAFGPGGAKASDAQGRISDVNHDGVNDLLAQFRIEQAGLTLGAASACVRGAFRNGRAFSGCDAIRTVPTGGNN